MIVMHWYLLGTHGNDRLQGLVERVAVLVNNKPHPDGCCTWLECSKVSLRCSRKCIAQRARGALGFASAVRPSC